MKKVLFITFSLVLLFGVVFAVSAKGPSSNASDNANENADIPEVSGDYAQPGHPGVRVRVFVHGPKAKGPKPPKPEVLSVCIDPASDAVVGPAGWKLPSTNWGYRINKSSVPSSVGAGNIEGIVLNNFSSWIDPIISSSKPSLNYLGTTSKNRSSYDGQNIIAWGRTSGSTLGVTYIRYYTSTGIVVDVDTIMNYRLPWVNNQCSANAYDAAGILNHEQGHWFGLIDHYAADYINNTMYGYGSKGETKKITPENGDKAGINLIYR